MAHFLPPFLTCGACTSLLITLPIICYIILYSYNVWIGDQFDIVTDTFFKGRHFVSNLTPPGVIVRPHGGIGNQLFEYACSYAVAKEKSWPLYVILRKLPDNRDFSAEDRDFALDQFHLPLDKLIEESTVIPKGKLEYVSDEDLLHRRITTKNNNGYIQQSGYCQSEAYWRQHKDEIISMFQPRLKLESLAKLESLLHDIGSTESVAVHVRRGDFLNKKGFFVPLSYQRTAIRRIVKLIEARRNHQEQEPSVQPIVFFVFSDDIQHTQSKLKDFHKRFRFVYVSSTWNTSSVEDFYLMTKCKHIIIPNSTFGWWAAYLNRSTDRIVIASAFNPKFWDLWNAGEKRFYKKLHGTLYHPKEWIVIDTFSGEL